MTIQPSKAFLKREMREYLQSVPDATPEEIAELKAWVAAGNSPYCNPKYIADERGCEMPFIHGLRAEQKLYEQMMEERKANLSDSASAANSFPD